MIHFKKIIALSVAITLLIGVTSVTSTNVLAKKSPKYYQKKLIKYIKKNGYSDGSWKSIKVKSGSVSANIETKGKKIAFVGYYKDSEGASGNTWMEFKVGNSPKISGHASVFDYPLSVFANMKKVGIKSFKKSKISYSGLKSSGDMSASEKNKFMRNFTYSFKTYWKKILKKAKVTFKQLGLKKF